MEGTQDHKASKEEATGLSCYHCYHRDLLKNAMPLGSQVPQGQLKMISFHRAVHVTATLDTSLASRLLHYLVDGPAFLLKQVFCF